LLPDLRQITTVANRDRREALKAHRVQKQSDCVAMYAFFTKVDKPAAHDPVATDKSSWKASWIVDDVFAQVLVACAERLQWRPALQAFAEFFPRYYTTA